MNIPEFPLPSNRRIVIQFRKPTVSDAMEYSETDPNFEERTTTKYLNALQVGDVRDSALWTASDRRAALWWIYISSNPMPEATFAYECQHCGETHHQDLNLFELDAGAKYLDREPVIRLTLPTNGEPVEWSIVPLDGRGVELLEQYRVNNLTPLPKDSKEYKAEAVRIRLLEDALRTRLSDDPEDYEEAAERRLSIIMGMCCATEYPTLAARILQSEDVLRHGLESVMERGETLLVAPAHFCKTKAQEVSEDGGAVPFTNLLFTFRPSNFFPQL